MLGIIDFNLQNSKSVTQVFFFQMRRNFRRCDENHIVHGARLDGGNPIVEVFACFLLIFLLFLFHLWLFVVYVAVLLLFFALPITTPGPVARERN